MSQRVQELKSLESMSLEYMSERVNESKNLEYMSLE
jgi:hypothetical protein